MKHDYTALDSAIKEALATGPKKFRELESDQGIKKQGVKLGAAHNANVSVSWDELKPWHFLVRRLDALEFNGEIQNGGPVIGWSLKGEA